MQDQVPGAAGDVPCQEAVMHEVLDLQGLNEDPVLAFRPVLCRGHAGRRCSARQPAYGASPRAALFLAVFAVTQDVSRLSGSLCHARGLMLRLVSFFVIPF